MLITVPEKEYPNILNEETLVSAETKNQHLKNRTHTPRPSFIPLAFRFPRVIAISAISAIQPSDHLLNDFANDIVFVGLVHNLGGTGAKILIF